jgi:hypothetical protein
MKDDKDIIEVKEVEAERINREEETPRSNFKFQSFRLSPFFGLGILVYVVTAFWGLIICFDIVKEILGGVLAFISLIFFPFVLTLAPWYALLVNHDFYPLIIIYGGGLLGWLCFSFGAVKIRNY